MLFSEVYGSYYNVVAGILAEAVRGELTTQRIQEIVREKAYLESGLSIPTALKRKDWPLLKDDLTTPVRHAPTMPLTTLEKQWMKAVLKDPRVQLFDPPAQDLDDVEPLFEPDFFVWFDRYADGDPFEDIQYREHFRLALLALKENRSVRIRYRGKRYRHDQFYIPEKLEYSPKDDKFRLVVRSSRGTAYVIRMASILEISLAEQVDLPVPCPEPEKETVVLELVDERNALERAMIHFSDLEKETVRLDQTHYRLSLRYRKADETEILIRILSFGPRIRVTSPESFLERIKERLTMQKRFEKSGF